MLRRTPLKRGTKRLKKTSLKKGVSRLKKKSSKPEERDLDYAGDVAFYNRIWNSRAHYCFESGAYLGDEPRSYMFHHVLEKSKFPQYRHEEWNIVLVSFPIHEQVHLNIDKTPKVKFLRGQLLKKIENEQVQEP